MNFQKTGEIYCQKNKKRHPLYSVFMNMKMRCYNPKYWKFERYGGRGIEICIRWLGKDGFKNFVLDMGDRPQGFQIDRIDNDGDYKLSNCRWVNKYVQMGNTSTNNQVPGVGWHKQRGKWRARIKINGFDKSLGLFESLKEAVFARQQAEKILCNS